MDMKEMQDMIKKSVSDLGVAAYLKINGFRCIGRRGRDYYFEFPKEDEHQFNELQVNYLNSAMHDFDAALMSLKKLSDYVAK
jgi:hypothetical protein